MINRRKFMKWLGLGATAPVAVSARETMTIELGPYTVDYEDLTERPDPLAIRFSGDENDIGYLYSWMHHDIKVTLDGEYVEDPILTVDERHGYIVTEDDGLSQTIKRGNYKLHGITDEHRLAHIDNMKNRRIMEDV